MRTFGKIVGVIALLIGGGYVWWQLTYPTYVYRYRLTLSIEVDGKVHTGSSVIEIIWSGGPEIGDVGPYHPKIKGQAVYVDLGQGGAVLTSLVAPAFLDHGKAQFPEGIPALWLAARAFGNQSTNVEFPELPRLRGRRDLTTDNMPRLIWFSNPADPKSAHRIKPDDIPRVFGATARFAAAYVEITRDPIVIDIDKKLPWFDILRRPLAQGLIQIEYGFAFANTMFVGDAS